MDERELLLVMTICELLGKSATPQLIEKTYDRMKTKLLRADQRQAESRSAHRDQS
jgi:hypothetical protein